MSKRLIAASLALGIMLVFSGVSFAGDAFKATGEVVEMNCYKNRNASGEGHASCAKKCLGDGAAMGLLLEDGSIVEIEKTDDAVYKAAIDLAGKQAAVTGTKGDDGKVSLNSVQGA